MDYHIVSSDICTAIKIIKLLKGNVYLVSLHCTVYI